MHNILRVFMRLLLASATLAYAQDVRPGDQVRLIEREQHIPAHPTPGDPRVHLRFVSGSAATVPCPNAATGWIEVRGEPLQGADRSMSPVWPITPVHTRTGGACLSGGQTDTRCLHASSPVTVFAPDGPLCLMEGSIQLMASHARALAQAGSGG